MSNNMDNAISNLLTRAKNSATTATAEELVYLAKAIEAVAPGESINFLMQAAEDEVATINSTGTTKVNAVNSAGTTKVNAVNSAGNAKVSEINALATGTFKTVGGESILGSGDIQVGSHTLLQRHSNTTKNPGTWAVPHYFGWVPYLYTDFTPISSTSVVRVQVHFSADSRGTGSISTGAIATSPVGGSSPTYEYYVNNSGHSYYYGHSQNHTCEIASWGSTAKRIGFMMGKHSSGYNIYAHRKTWGSPSDPGGTSSANADRSCYILVEEWEQN